MSARILVVDDVPANVKLLEARLSAEYFDVVTASSGAQAIEICTRAECDIILLDVMMPERGGVGGPPRLKSHPGAAFLPGCEGAGVGHPRRSRPRSRSRR